MTARLILAIAAHRKIRLVRQGRQQIEGPAVFRLRHLGAITFHESGPLLPGFSMQSQFDRLRRRRQIREPHVVPVARREFGFRNAAGRPPDRADAQPFVRGSCRTQTDYSNGQNGAMRTDLFGFNTFERQPRSCLGENKSTFFSFVILEPCAAAVRPS